MIEEPQVTGQRESSWLSLKTQEEVHSIWRHVVFGWGAPCSGAQGGRRDLSAEMLCEAMGVGEGLRGVSRKGLKTEYEERQHGKGRQRTESEPPESSGESQGRVHLIETKRGANSKKQTVTDAKRHTEVKWD